MKLSNFASDLGDTLAGGAAIGATTYISSHEAGTASMHVASAVTITDAGNYYVGSTVEAALQELGTAAVPSLVVYDESSLIGTPTAMKFTGDGVTATYSGGTATVTVTVGTASTSIPVFDEGTLMGTATAGINFTGAAVSGTVTSGTAVVTISSGVDLVDVVQFDFSTTTATSLALPSTPVAGNTILLVTDSTTGQVTNVASTNTTWTQVATYTSSGSSYYALWVGVVGSSPGATITWTKPGTYAVGLAIEADLALGGTATATDTDDTNKALSITTTAGRVIVVAGGADNTTLVTFAECLSALTVGAAGPVAMRIGYARGTKTWGQVGGSAGGAILAELT